MLTLEFWKVDLLCRCILNWSKVDILDQFTSIMNHIVKWYDLYIFRESGGVCRFDLVFKIHNGSHWWCMRQNIFEFRQKLVGCDNMRGLKMRFSITKLSNDTSQCLKISQNVAFNIASEVSYVYILSGQKIIENAKNGPFWRVFVNLKLAVKQCYQTGQF